jgi:di/tricarboxylate transporter
MSVDVIQVTVILAAVIIFFITGWIRMDIVPLLIPVSLIVTGLVTAEEVFSGFSSSAVITVASLFVITTGLVRSGVVNRVADSLNRLTGKSNQRLILASTLLPGAVAGIVIVTATVLFFIPTILRMALQRNISRSKLLLPLVASCLLGANLTLIGASHNLVANSLVEDALGISFSLFEFMPMGAVLLLVCVAYCLLFGWRLLPGDDPSKEKPVFERADLIKTYNLEDRLWELWVQDDSLAVGKSIRELGLGERFGLSVMAVVRSEDQMPAECKELEIAKDDVLLVLGREDKVNALAESESLFLAGHPLQQKRFPLSTAEMVELVIPPRSPVIGKTLAEIHFRENTGLSGIALWRDGRPFRTDVGNMTLREGDGLLLYGDRKKTRSFEPGKSFRWLHPPRKEQAPPELKPYGPLAVFILLLVIASAALGWLPISVAAISGAAAMVITRILRPSEIYESIEWRAVIMIGCLYPLGIALNNSGASALLAEQLLQIGRYDPTAVLAAIAILSLLLTQPMHNVAAAVIMTPVALNASQVLGANPKAFVVAVIVGASAAFIMPIGHPVSLLVQKPGNYSAGDYLKFGAGLGLLVLLAAILVIPLIWPFFD